MAVQFYGALITGQIGKTVEERYAAARLDVPVLPMQQVSASHSMDTSGSIDEHKDAEIGQ